HAAMVTVLAFARYRTLLGFDRVQIPLPKAATLGVLLADARFEALPKDALLAVNQAFVKREAQLKEGDEVALMPPVSGG
ncbi:MAG: MoaD/ThiS family protein, partial [Acidobacteriota bacterium]|nr:MoaD/ThiS family protein [Acidobacteriota bacterium]